MPWYYPQPVIPPFVQLYTQQCGVDNCISGTTTVDSTISPFAAIQGQYTMIGMGVFLDASGMVSNATGTIPTTQPHITLTDVTYTDVFVTLKITQLARAAIAAQVEVNLGIFVNEGALGQWHTVGAINVRADALAQDHTDAITVQLPKYNYGLVGTDPIKFSIGINSDLGSAVLIDTTAQVFISVNPSYRP